MGASLGLEPKQRATKKRAYRIRRIALDSSEDEAGVGVSASPGGGEFHARPCDEASESGFNEAASMHEADCFFAAMAVAEVEDNGDDIRFGDVLSDSRMRVCQRDLPASSAR